MPRLTDERRKEIEEQQKREAAFWLKIEEKYHTKSKRHAQCRLCGEMVSAIEPEDVFVVMEIHEREHPEYEEWVGLSKRFDFSDLRDMLHDHDCVFVSCACECGCRTSFCAAEISPEERCLPQLCDMCLLYQGRGHVEHRLSEVGLKGEGK